MWKRLLLAGLGLMLGTVQIAQASDIQYVINDHLGTPQMLVDEQQNVVWEAHYSPFGEADLVVEQVEFNLRFPGQYYDKETGLHYNYFRDYDPSLGRYVQSDPIGLAGGINTFAYVGGNPLSYVDPTGESPIVIAIGTAALLGIGLAVSANNPAAQEGYSDLGESLSDLKCMISESDFRPTLPEDDKCLKEWFADMLMCDVNSSNSFSKAYCQLKAHIKYAGCKGEPPDDTIDPPLGGDDPHGPLGPGGYYDGLF